jgi:Uma2 family endonuclease
MFQRQLKYYTPEEYLALEEAADYKSEYYQGDIFAMAGGSANHNRIAGNFYAVLNFAFASGPCDAFMNDMRLLIKQSGLYTYPDVMVACDQIEFVPNRTDTLTNPVLIVEVLSESTEGYDRGKKFEFYRAIPSLRHYLLIAQERVHLEYFQKMASGLWTLQEFNDLDDILKIETLGVEIPLNRIYNKVTFEVLE